MNKRIVLIISGLLSVCVLGTLVCAFQVKQENEVLAAQCRELQETNEVLQELVFCLREELALMQESLLELKSDYAELLALSGRPLSSLGTI